MSADPRRVFTRRLAEELTARLVDADGAPIKFEPGPREGPIDDRDVGFIWWEGMRPFSRDGNGSEDYYRVRLFKRWRQDQGGEEPRATVHDHILDVTAELEAALKANLVCDGHDYFVVAEVTPDWAQQCVNAQLTAYDRNRSAAGG